MTGHNTYPWWSSHNNWKNATTGKSLFQLLIGYHLQADWNNAPSTLPQVETHLEQLKEVRRQAQTAMIKAQNKWIKHKEMPRYQMGDLIWLEGHNLCISQPMAKLAPRCHSPFKIDQVLSPISYHLILPMWWCIHPVFHTDLLNPYHKMALQGQNYSWPPPALVDGTSEEYKVEKVLVSRCKGQRKKLQYLIKWKGYPDLDNKWVNHKDMLADDEVRKYHKRVIEDKSRAFICKTHHPTPPMSHSPTSSIISISANASAQDIQALVHNQGLEEAMAHFPTPEPGHLSPNSAETCDISLNPCKGIEHVLTQSPSMEEVSMTMEGQADSQGKEEAGGSTKEDVQECDCRAPDPVSCTCIGRCPQQWVNDCTFCQTSCSQCLVMAYVTDTPSWWVDSYIILTLANISWCIDSFLSDMSADRWPGRHTPPPEYMSRVTNIGQTKYDWPSTIQFAGKSTENRKKWIIHYECSTYITRQWSGRSSSTWHFILCWIYQLSGRPCWYTLPS